MKNLTHVVPRPLCKDYYTLKTHLNEKKKPFQSQFPLFFSKLSTHTSSSSSSSSHSVAQPPRSTQPTISLNQTHDFGQPNPSSRSLSLCRASPRSLASLLALSLAHLFIFIFFFSLGRSTSTLNPTHDFAQPNPRFRSTQDLSFSLSLPRSRFRVSRSR